MNALSARLFFVALALCLFVVAATIAAQHFTDFVVDQRDAAWR